MEELKIKIESLIAESVCGGPMAIGSFNTSYSRCSNKNCKCHDKVNPQKHIGYNVSYSIKGKSKAKRVRKGEVEFAKSLTANYKKHREVVLELGQSMMELAREVGFEQAQEFYKAAYVRVLQKLTGVKQSDRKLDVALERVRKWKEKAAMRYSELTRKSIKIRDLTNSRDNWRVSAKKLKIELDKSEKEVEDLKKNVDKVNFEFDKLKKTLAQE